MTLATPILTPLDTRARGMLVIRWVDEDPIVMAIAALSRAARVQQCETRLMDILADELAPVDSREIDRLLEELRRP